MVRLCIVSRRLNRVLSAYEALWNDSAPLGLKKKETVAEAATLKGNDFYVHYTNLGGIRCGNPRNEDEPPSDAPAKQTQRRV